MSHSFSELAKDLTKTTGVAADEVRAVFAALGAAPPEDYVAFMSQSNGAEGPIGDQGYLVLWPTSQIGERNEGYHVAEFAPALVLFGSDGGDTAFAFDKRVPGRVLGVPFIGMTNDATEILGNSFVEFLTQLR